MTVRRCIALLLAFTILFSVSPAPCQFSVGINATVGLDGPTQALIAGLPQNVREQIIKTLQEALPLLDQSIQKYLAQVNQILDSQINNAQCSMDGIVAEVDRRLHLPGARTKGPLEIFDKDTKGELDRLGRYDDATFYGKVYGDIFYDASVTLCEMKIANGNGNFLPEANRYRKLNNLWLRLSGTCSSPRNCIAKEVQVTHDFITSSDPRDVAAADALTRFTAVASSLPENPWPWQTFNPQPYEDTLAKLLDIQDETNLAKVVRTAREAASIADARQILDALDAKSAAAQTILTPKPTFPCSHYVDDGMVSAAQAQADAMSILFEKFKADLKEAVELDATQKAAADQIQQQLRPRVDSYSSIRNAHKSLTGPDPGCKIH